ncbi:hypothetical protein GOB93_14705 [Acetobacter musti]|uniref:Uncharacterized protein n=1 Tax=Acetobacter musti TaxID=864732 RepID=A0ABX0JQZ5_9PROT|nr:hypothetical protein [Acetobacter musti]NHN85883.1 hypothetical protein [Acetobacter musti]
MSTLEDTARSAGLKDMSLLECVRKDLPPAGQVADLKSRYPQAFAPAFDARTASKADVEARLKQMGVRLRRSMM